jgi:hypothetical protein
LHNDIGLLSVMAQIEREPQMRTKYLAAAVILLSLASGGMAVAQGYAPPPPPPEVVPPPPPSAQAWVWRPGFWRWDGRTYVWVAGRYVHPPRAHAVWIPGHWDARPRGWVWVPGHWG